MPATGVYGGGGGGIKYEVLFEHFKVYRGMFSASLNDKTVTIDRNRISGQGRIEGMF